MGRVAKRIETGSLIKRGNTYSVKFQQIDSSGNKKQIWKVLKDEAGKSVTDYATAVKMKSSILSEFVIKDEKKFKEKLLSSIKSDDEKIQEAAKIADELLNPPLKVSEAWNAYEENQNRPQSGERTLKDYAGYWNKFVKWLSGNYPKITALRDVTSETASDYAAYLKRQKLSAGTFNKNRDFLKIFFHFLKAMAKMELNPFEGLTRLKDEQQTRRELTENEIKIILENAEGDLKMLLGLGVFTGLRLGDCATLKWSEINLDSRVIQRVPNKTGGKALTIGLPEVLFTKLNETPPAERKGYILPLMAERYISTTTRPGIVRMIQKHFIRCGIQIYQEGTGSGTKKRAVIVVGFHSLRHSYVSILAKQGISQNVLVKLAGHSSKMSEHYTHIQPGEAYAISQNAFKGFVSDSEAIEVKAISEVTPAEKRLESAIEWLKTAQINDEAKAELLNILEPEK